MRAASAILSRASAALLALGGLALLFASDRILPWLAPGMPPNAAWIGQLIAAGWAGIAFHNWIAREQRLGGIYGRPTVLLNLMLYMISALGLVKADGAPMAVRVMAIPFGAMAALYGAVLLRGPFDS